VALPAAGATALHSPREMKQDLTEFRSEILPMLEEQGFRVAASLPTIKDLELRPIGEVATRFGAIRALSLWVCTDEDVAPSAKVAKWMEEHDGAEALTESEREILALDRADAHEQFVNDIGWKFEGAFSLAWILGFGDEGELGTDGEMIDQDRISKMFFEFAPRFDDDFDEWLRKQTVRDEETIVGFEDLLYCVHNAGRSAMLGNADCCPDWWHPVISTGVIQERRKGLTWALTPGCKWDDTDVST